jgi:hypothetical protein
MCPKGSHLGQFHPFHDRVRIDSNFCEYSINGIVDFPSRPVGIDPVEVEESTDPVVINSISQNVWMLLLLR